jgi:putative membrane protein
MRQVERKTRLVALWIAVCCVSVSSVRAHGGEVPGPDDVWTAWSFDPLVVLSLILSATIYLVGLANLRRASEKGGINTWAITAFWSGWFALFIALVSPIHELGSALFSVHMMQHEILMLVAAPLFVMGQPLIATMWALPQSWRKPSVRLLKTDAIERARRFLTNGFAAWSIHAAALWVWHIPYLFQATLKSDVVHTLQHVSFFGSALLFWWAIINSPRAAASYGAGILYLFTTSIHSGILGAFLTFTTRVWYPVYSDTTSAWGLTPIEDQQLGGMIMWVPAGIVYIAAALFMFAGWMRESEKRVRRREAMLAGSNI